jgi:putative hydrolase of the HAD superfamily
MIFRMRATYAPRPAHLSCGYLGLLARVGLVFTAEAIGVAKPHRNAFHVVCQAFDLPPDRVLYVGDDYAIDVLAARAAGLQAVHFDRMTPEFQPADDSVATITDLSDVVTRTRP